MTISRPYLSRTAPSQLGLPRIKSELDRTLDRDLNVCTEAGLALRRFLADPPVDPRPLCEPDTCLWSFRLFIIQHKSLKR